MPYGVNLLFWGRPILSFKGHNLIRILRWANAKSENTFVADHEFVVYEFYGKDGGIDLYRELISFRGKL